MSKNQTPKHRPALADRQLQLALQGQKMLLFFYDMQAAGNAVQEVWDTLCLLRIEGAKRNCHQIELPSGGVIRFGSIARAVEQSQGLFKDWLVEFAANPGEVPYDRTDIKRFDQYLKRVREAEEVVVNHFKMLQAYLPPAKSSQSQSS